VGVYTKLRSIMSRNSVAKNLDRCASVIPFHCILLRMTDFTLDCNLVLAFNFHLGKVFHQHPVDEDIPAAYFLEENAISGVVEETSVVPGDVVVEVKD